MRIAHFLLALAIAGLGFADTLTLRDGKVVNGTYLGGTSRQIRMEVGDKIETYDVDRVASLQFQTAPSAAVPSPPTAPSRERASVFRPEVSATPARSASSAGVELPVGTVFTVRMIDSVDSERNRVGEVFQASLDEPVMLNAETAIPRGADVVVKLVDDKESGKLSGRTELTLDLMSVRVNGKVVDVNTQSVTQSSESRTGRTGKVVGGTAALGAIIGAIAGGGKGAAIGAASGAGAGTAVQVITKGQRVRIPSETRLTFTLQNAVRI
jgi:hypothetical protein